MDSIRDWNTRQTRRASTNAQAETPSSSGKPRLRQGYLETVGRVSADPAIGRCAPSRAPCIIPRMHVWSDQPDGSRARDTNGIRIVDRTTGAVRTRVEHLVTWQEEGGRVVFLGLDEGCRPVTLTTMYSYR
jgi:hypothetical protein